MEGCHRVLLHCRTRCWSRHDGVHDNALGFCVWQWEWDWTIGSDGVVGNVSHQSLSVRNYPSDPVIRLLSLSANLAQHDDKQCIVSVHSFMHAVVSHVPSLATAPDLTPIVAPAHISTLSHVSIHSSLSIPLEGRVQIVEDETLSGGTGITRTWMFDNTTSITSCLFPSGVAGLSTTQSACHSHLPTSP